jgi:hypothetical protein
MGPYSLEKTRLRTGGLAEIKKFNEGGINYLPSKVSHDENDSNNYVRAQRLCRGRIWNTETKTKIQC